MFRGRFSQGNYENVTFFTKEGSLSLFIIRLECPNHLSLLRRKIFSIGGCPVISSIFSFDILSLRLIPIIVRRYFIYKLMILRSCRVVMDHVSLPYSNTGRTQARNIRYFAMIEIDFLFHIAYLSILKAVAASDNLVLISESGF